MLFTLLSTLLLVLGSQAQLSDVLYTDQVCKQLYYNAANNCLLDTTVINDCETLRNVTNCVEETFKYCNPNYKQIFMSRNMQGFEHLELWCSQTKQQCDMQVLSYEIGVCVAAYTVDMSTICEKEDEIEACLNPQGLKNCDNSTQELITSSYRTGFDMVRDRFCNVQVTTTTTTVKPACDLQTISMEIDTCLSPYSIASGTFCNHENEIELCYQNEGLNSCDNSTRQLIISSYVSGFKILRERLCQDWITGPVTTPVTIAPSTTTSEATTTTSTITSQPSTTTSTTSHPTTTSPTTHSETTRTTTTKSTTKSTTTSEPTTTTETITTTEPTTTTTTASPTTTSQPTTTSETTTTTESTTPLTIITNTTITSQSTTVSTTTANQNATTETIKTTEETTPITAATTTTPIRTTTTTATTQTNRPTSDLRETTSSSPSNPPYQCFSCHSGGSSFHQITQCPANGRLNGWALNNFVTCNSPCVTAVKRYPLVTWSAAAQICSI